MLDRVTFFTMFSVVIILGLSSISLPYVGSKGTLMGVDLPREEQKKPAVRRIIREFQLLSLLLAAAFGVGMVLVPRREEVVLGFMLSGIVVVLGVQTLLFAWVNGRLKRYKREQKITIPGVGRRAVDLAMAKNPYRDLKFSMKLYLFPLFLILGMGIYTGVQAPHLPDTLPTHIGLKGPDAWGDKSFFTVWGMVLGTLLVLGIFYVVTRIMITQKKTLNPNHPVESRERWKKAIGLWAWYLYGAAVGEVVLFLWGQMMILNPKTWAREELMNAFGVYVLVYVFLVLILAVVLGVKVGNTGSRLEILGEEDAFEDEDDHWYLGGSVYYNPGDPAVMVPKRLGIGTTINAATLPGKLLYGFLILLMAGLFGMGIYFMVTG